MPGVSTKTTWASGRCSTPRIRCRVVLGRDEVMETLVPDHLVDQGRLAHVGPADHGHEARAHQ